MSPLVTCHTILWHVFSESEDKRFHKSSISTSATSNAQPALIRCKDSCTTANIGKQNGLSARFTYGEIPTARISNQELPKKFLNRHVADLVTCQLIIAITQDRTAMQHSEIAYRNELENGCKRSKAQAQSFYRN